MLRPFFDRQGDPVSPERWEQLTREDGYSMLAVDQFLDRSVIVRTRWLGHDREDNVPPRIFATQALGDSNVAEVATATELEALNVHAALCTRYRDQSSLILDGGAPLLSDGVL